MLVHVTATDNKLVFVTGTDTGVGKTLLTAILARYLIITGRSVAALKPVSTGSRTDAKLLFEVQDRRFTLDQINPLHFAKPAAPCVAAAAEGARLVPAQIIRHIEKFRTKADWLLVEGVGGLMAPITHKFTVRDLIRRLRCHVLVVAPNRLGVINHTLLTIEALAAAAPVSVSLVLMNPATPDHTVNSNPALLNKLIPNVPVEVFPYFGRNLRTREQIDRLAKTFQPKLKKVLARLEV